MLRIKVDNDEVRIRAKKADAMLQLAEAIMAITCLVLWVDKHFKWQQRKAFEKILRCEIARLCDDHTTEDEDEQ